MERAFNAINLQKEAMLIEFPDKEQLTCTLFSIISNMIQEDFDAVSRSKKKLKITFNCIREVLEKASLQSVRKKYAIDIINTFLDDEVVFYLNSKLDSEIETYTRTLEYAKSNLVSSQWSDKSSTHWERVISLFQL